MSSDEEVFKSSNGINWKSSKHVVSTLKSSDSIVQSKRKPRRRKKK